MTTRRILGIGAALLTGALTLTACAATSEPSHDRPEADVAKARQLTPSLNDAGFAIFRAAQEGDENLAVSPLSIGTAFGMVDVGASGPVKDALQELFQYWLTGEDRLQGFNSLDLSASSEAGKGAENAEGETVDLPIVRIANRVFVDQEFSPNPDYIATVGRYFGADAIEAPLRTDPQKSRDMIDRWISQRTEGLIPKIMPPTQPNSDTQLILANAVYLKAQWHFPFDAEDTFPRDFSLADGTIIQADAMYQTVRTGSVSTDQYAAAVLPYVGDLEMLVVVPTEGSFNDVVAGLSQDFLDTLDGQWESQQTAIQLPRFTTGSTVDLRDVIENRLGITTLFGVEGLDGIGPQLAVSSAIHATKVIVDEEGTEAAAATVIGIEIASAPVDEPLAVIADRPFLYLIRDTTTGAVLFVGRIMDPTAG